MEREALLKPCNLRKKELNFAPQNDDNAYCKNFKGEFCHCERGKTYDPEKEDEVNFNDVGIEQGDRGRSDTPLHLLRRCSNVFLARIGFMNPALHYDQVKLSMIYTVLREI